MRLQSYIDEDGIRRFKTGLGFNVKPITVYINHAIIQMENNNGKDKRKK